MSFTFIIGALVAYLLGSIPSGLWIGQYFFQKDIRQFGSGNLGSTNAFRVLGKKAGSVVLFCDVFKGFLAMVLAMTVFKQDSLSPLWIASFAVIGHTFPLFASFKGGKAVATSAGVILGFSPLFLIYLLVVFIIVLWLFSMISLSSVIGAIFALLGILIFPSIGFILTSYDLLFSIIIFVLAIIIILRHRTNLKRIKNHCESLVPFGLNLSKQKEK